MQSLSGRRTFLKSSGAAAVWIATAPNIIAWLPSNNVLLPSLTTYPTDSPIVDRTLEQLVASRYEASPLTAFADTAEFAGDYKMAATPEAISQVADLLGLDKTVFNAPDYREGSQCTENYRRQEAAWRQRGLNAFTRIQRPQAQRDVSFCSAAQIYAGARYGTALATQYQAYRSFELTGDQPGVLVAAAMTTPFSTGTSAREMAMRMAITHKDENATLGGSLVTRYETPALSFVHDPRPHVNNSSGRRYPKGIVYVHDRYNRRNVNNLRWAGLYV